MSYNLAPEQRSEALKQLGELLNEARIQDLRGAARLWGWPLRGTSKSDLVAQMLAYLSESPRMARAYTTLPPVEQEALAWLNTLRGLKLAQPLAAVLRLCSGHELSEEAMERSLADLQARALLFVDRNHGYIVPMLCVEWLPEQNAPALVYTGPMQAQPAPTAEALAGDVDTLLAEIESYRPRMAGDQSEAMAVGTGPDAGLTILPRPGLLPPEALARLGYSRGEEFDRARFLLELMLSEGLLHADLQNHRLEIVPDAVIAWSDMTPRQRRANLMNGWMLNYQKLGHRNGRPLGFHELDMALRAVEPHKLRALVYWDMRRAQLENTAAVLRAWLMSLLLVLRLDTWYDFARFEELVAVLQRDLFRTEYFGMAWQWQRDRQKLDPYNMSLDTWRATYGTLIEAWFAGPARWLGIVQIATDHGRLVAFCRPSLPPTAEPDALSADALAFLPEDRLRLRNLWQTATLRPLIRRIAVEEKREREHTTYRLDAAAFRAARAEGTSAGEVIQAFAAAGFPLPPAISERLRLWQDHAGRYQIYENLAVIEFADDLALEEIQAAIGLRPGITYAVSPRYLIVLQPDEVPGLVEELRRKGYTPQVLAANDAGGRP